MTYKLWDLNVLLCAACDHAEGGGSAFDFEPQRYPAFGRLVEALTDGKITAEPRSFAPDEAATKKLLDCGFMWRDGNWHPPEITSFMTMLDALQRIKALAFGETPWPSDGEAYQVLNEVAVIATHATQEVSHGTVSVGLRDKIRELAQRVVGKYPERIGYEGTILFEFESTLHEIIRLTETP